MSELTVGDLGLTSEQSSTLPAEHAQTLAATLDVTFDPARPLPLLWHRAYFNASSGRPIGTRRRPPSDQPVAGRLPGTHVGRGRSPSRRSLHTGVPSVRRTRLLSDARKHGSTGDLLIVTVEHTIEQDGRIVIVERQDVIYRPAAGVTPPAGLAMEPPPIQGWRESVLPTSTLLFRFSAVTFNGHRIHYDHDYATGVEHYPSLVVHGPLTAMVLAQSASHQLGRPLQLFAYRASSPLFVDQPIQVDGVIGANPEGETATMTATRIDGVVGMTATGAGQDERERSGQCWRGIRGWQ